mmetsp:Transcript_21649/g.35710  ORF Transcript_21649/g.35710 Transcript_21649/m.35710 type:complete len:230 (-) Transcript_21649:724-1413(-)
MGMDCHTAIRLLSTLSLRCTTLKDWLRHISCLVAWRVFPPRVIVRFIRLIIIIGDVGAIIVRPISCITIGIIRLLAIIIGPIGSTIIVISPVCATIAVIIIICPLISAVIIIIIRLRSDTFTMTTTLVVIKLDILEFVHGLKVIHTRGRRFFVVLMLTNDLFGRLDRNLFATGTSTMESGGCFFFLLLHSLFSHDDGRWSLPFIHRPLNRSALLSIHLTTISGTLLTNR